MTDFLPYGRQSITEEDVAAVVAALHDPMITQGPRVDSFERAFADAVGARHAVAFATGTAALHGAAVAAGLGPGDTLVTSPVSFVASANCALFTGARPAFADIDSTGNIDLAAAVAGGALDGARACVPVSLSGLPVDMAPLQELRAKGLVVIEDACHALGGRREGKPVGGDGQADMYAFSLHPVKSITTGEGGVVTTESDEYAERLRVFRTHWIVRDAGPPDALEGGWHYDVAGLGYNYRITDFQCALGESQLRRLDDFVRERNRVAARYRELLASIEGITLPAEPAADALHAYHLFVVRFTEGDARRRQVYDSLREAGIGTQLHYIPIYRHSLYRGLGFDGLERDMPGAEAYYREALSLPMFPAMTDADVERVVRELQQALTQPLPQSASLT